MKKIDIMLHRIAKEFNTKLIRFYKRFIDDIFIIWTGTEEELRTFMVKINKAHPTIKFTVSYNFAEKSTGAIIRGRGTCGTFQTISGFKPNVPCTYYVHRYI